MVSVMCLVYQNHELVQQGSLLQPRGLSDTQHARQTPSKYETQWILTAKPNKRHNFNNKSCTHNANSIQIASQAYNIITIIMEDICTNIIIRKFVVRSRLNFPDTNYYHHHYEQGASVERVMIYV